MRPLSSSSSSSSTRRTLCIGIRNSSSTTKVCVGGNEIVFCQAKSHSFAVVPSPIRWNDCWRFTFMRIPSVLLVFIRNKIDLVYIIHKYTYVFIFYISVI